MVPINVLEQGARFLLDGQEFTVVYKETAGVYIRRAVAVANEEYVSAFTMVAPL